MIRRGGTWSQGLRTGILWGGVAVFVSLVGMVEALAARQVVVDVISLGHSLLVLAGLGAGYHAARGAAAPVAVLGRGLLAGLVTGAMVFGLVLLGSAVNLRAMFVSASPALYEVLSLGGGIAGWPRVLGFWAGLSLLGAAAALLPRRIRRPLGLGLTWALGVGVFQDLIQLMLLGGGVVAAVRNLIFTEEGMLGRGAAVVFGVTVAASALWTRQSAAVGGWVATRSAGQRQGLRLVVLALGLLAVLGIPLVAGPFLSQVLVLVGLYALMGLGLNLEIGFAGLLDLGFVAFFAIGAYTVGLLTTTTELAIANLSFWTSVPIAVAIALIAGVVLGVPVLRIRGDYLAIATLGFGEIVRLLVLSDFLRPWLGGSQGVLGIPKPTLGGFEFAGPEQLFYLTLASSALVVFVAARLRDSRLGRAWMALREDEDVAEAMGINLVNIKLLAYGLGAAFAGLSGAIFAVMVASVFPHSFQLLISINVLALIIVGGMGSMPGVVVGSLALIGLPELLREFSDFRFLVYGAVLVAMMQLRPEGLWPAAAIQRELHTAEENDGGSKASEPAGLPTEG